MLVKGVQRQKLSLQFLSVVKFEISIYLDTVSTATLNISYSQAIFAWKDLSLKQCYYVTEKNKSNCLAQN